MLHSCGCSASNVRIKSRRDATRPNTLRRLFDGPSDRMMLSNVKIFHPAGKCVTQSFYLALCSYAPALAFLLSRSGFPPRAIEFTLKQSATRVICSSHSFSLSHLLSFSLRLFLCSRSLLSIPWCFPIPFYHNLDHFPFAISFACDGNVLGMYAWENAPCGANTHVLILLSRYASLLLSTTACVWWFSMNERCANIVFHFDFIAILIPTSQPASQTTVMYMCYSVIESAFFRSLWRVHIFFPAAIVIVAVTVTVIVNSIYY